MGGIQVVHVKGKKKVYVFPNLQPHIHLQQYVVVYGIFAYMRFIHD